MSLTNDSTPVMTGDEVAALAAEIGETGDPQVRQLHRLNDLFGAEWMCDLKRDATWTLEHPAEPQNRRKDGLPRTPGGVFFRLARERVTAQIRAKALRWQVLGWVFAPEAVPMPHLVPRPRKMPPAPRPRAPKPTREREPPPRRQQPPQGRLPPLPVGEPRNSYVSRPTGGTFGTGRGRRPRPEVEIVTLPSRAPKR